MTTYSLSQKAFAAQIIDLTLSEYRLLFKLIYYITNQASVYYSQNTLAKKLKVSRCTISRAVKKFIENGFITVLSGRSRLHTNIYFFTPEFQEFVENTDIQKIVKDIKYISKSSRFYCSQNSDFQRENATCSATQYNYKNDSRFTRYNKSYRHCGNVHKVRYPLSKMHYYVHPLLQKSPLSQWDQYYFSKEYDDRTIKYAMKLASRKKKLKNLGAFVNTVCRKLQKNI